MLHVGIDKLQVIKIMLHVGGSMLSYESVL